MLDWIINVWSRAGKGEDLSVRHLNLIFTHQVLESRRLGWTDAHMPFLHSAHSEYKDESLTQNPALFKLVSNIPLRKTFWYKIFNQY